MILKKNAKIKILFLLAVTSMQCLHATGKDESIFPKILKYISEKLHQLQHNSCKNNNQLSKTEDQIVAAPLRPGHKKTFKTCLSIPKEIQDNIVAEEQYPVLLQSILSLIKLEYVYELDNAELTEKAVIGLLTLLDPHSSFLNEQAINSLKNSTDGEFYGIGIEIFTNDSFLKIISPVDDTPAYKAGLKAGDIILYVDNTCTNGISSEEALNLLRAKTPTNVTLKIKRGNSKPFDVTIKRDIIKIQSVKTEIIDNIGYIRISTFDANTSKSISEFLEKKKGALLKGLIIDVRNNPGGLLEETVATANMFLSKGEKIVETIGRTPKNTNTFNASGKDITSGIPIVVLINENTASAPEIFAGAMQDNKRALILGTRSFGKGSVQKIFCLSETSGIKLTVAKHYTPNGHCIQSKGIIPDISVNSAFINQMHNNFSIREEFFKNALDAEQNIEKKREIDLQNKKAIDEICASSEKIIKTNNNEEDYELSSRSLPIKEKIGKDYQLSVAFKTINAITKYDTLVKQRRNND